MVARTHCSDLNKGYFRANGIQADWFAYYLALLEQDGKAALLRTLAFALKHVKT